MKRALLTTLILGLACIGWWLFPRSIYANLPPSGGTAWVAFGDSLTAGVGAEPGEDYPSQLSTRLGVPILNAGIPGHTTQDGLERVEEIVQLKPRVVLLCLGGNDGLRGVPPDQMTANLAAIVGRLQQAGAFVVLIGVRSASLLDKNAARFSRLAAKMNSLHVPDILEGVFGRPDLMSDAIHPNPAGYGVIAGRIANTLEPLLPELK